MPKKLTEEDMRIAYSIYKDGLEIIDPYENDFIPAPTISAERAIIKKEAFENLSNEAKELIQIILNSPTEILEALATPKSKRITKNSIFQHLSKIFRSKFIARLIIEEIQEWVKHL